MKRKRNWRVCKHQWGSWKTLNYGGTTIGYAAIRTCTVCRTREFNDWTRDRIGNYFEILPPEQVKPE
jgi:hypothetical protein